MKKVYLTIWTIALIIFCSYMKIKATTFTTELAPSGNGYATSNTSGWSDQGAMYVRNVANGDNLQNFEMYYSPILNTYQHDYISFVFTASQPLRNLQTNYDYEYMCDEWQEYTTAYGPVTSCNNTETYDTTQNAPYAITITEYNFQFKIYYEGNSGWAFCNMQNSEVVCPTNGKNVDHMRITVNLKTLEATQIKIGLARGYNLYKTNSTAQAIQDQTQQQQQQYEQATNGTWTPNNNINTEQNGANETIEWGQQEEALLDSLDMNTTMLSDITINPTASAFIWDIVGGLRNMNPAIIMVMTSILGLGIAKMLLNR